MKGGIDNLPPGESAGKESTGTGENPNLSEIIDIAAIQSLMDDFYVLARIPMSIIDLRGRVLVGVGWQDICTKFHRVNPETCRHCIESDTTLTEGVAPGEFRLYKCKNNMWDIATPIMVDGRHVGNLFSGQFFFDDETPDDAFFRAQARRYGFDEQTYIPALERVPRLSRKMLETGMSFFVKLATMISKLGHGNLELKRTLAERKKAEAALRESEEDLNRAQAVAQTGSWRLDTRRNELRWSDETYRIFGIPKETPMTYEKFLSHVHPEDREWVDGKWKKALRGKPYEIEHRIVVDNGIVWVRERAELEFDGEGSLRGGFGTVQDITERTVLEQRIAQFRREQDAFMRHEVKNYFTPIQMYADILLRDAGNLTEQQVRYLRRITESTVRVAGFIDSLKRIHDIEAGFYPLQKQEYPVDSIVRQAVRDLEPLAERSGVTVRYTPPRKHILIPLDIQLMPGVFINLIKNAIEHVARLGNPGEKVVTVTFRREKKKHIVRINNKGEPVPPDRQATFFEMFNSGKEKRFGTGLGTTYAYLVAKAHGGNVEVTSSRCEGTTLTVSFSAE